MNEFDRGILRQLYVDAVSDCAIILLDTEGNVQTWNTGARAILGYHPSEILGLHYSRLFSKDQAATARPAALLDNARAMDWHQETGRLLARNGIEVEAHSVVTAVYDQRRRLLGFGILARAVTAAKPAIAARSAESPSPEEHEHILVVDDDEQVLEAALSQLKSLGYRVTGASNGAEALEMLASIRDVDLLFTDVSMPGGMGGQEVAEKARQLRPDLKVLFASGYFGHALVHSGSLVESAQVLVKPYRKRDLAQKVREALGGAAP